MKKQADTAEGTKAADDLREFEVKRIKVSLSPASEHMLLARLI